MAFTKKIRSLETRTAARNPQMLLAMQYADQKRELQHKILIFLALLENQKSWHALANWREYVSSVSQINSSDPKSILPAKIKPEADVWLSIYIGPNPNFRSRLRYFGVGSHLWTSTVEHGTSTTGVHDRQVRFVDMIKISRVRYHKANYAPEACMLHPLVCVFLVWFLSLVSLTNETQLLPSITGAVNNVVNRTPSRAVVMNRFIPSGMFPKQSLVTLNNVHCELCVKIFKFCPTFTQSNSATAELPHIL